MYINRDKSYNLFGQAQGVSQKTCFNFYPRPNQKKNKNLNKTKWKNKIEKENKNKQNFE